MDSEFKLKSLASSDILKCEVSDTIVANKLYLMTWWMFTQTTSIRASDFLKAFDPKAGLKAPNPEQMYTGVSS